jgi:hypothetical protein
MRPLLLLSGFTFLFLSMVSCEDRTLKESTLSQLNAESEIYDFLAFIEDRDAAVESLGERYESLVFTSEMKETKAIFWYENDTLRIIRHQIRDIKTNTQIEKSFYFDNSGLILVQELIDKPISEEEIETTEFITYCQNEKPVRSWTNLWNGGFADPLQYKDTPLRDCDFSETLDMYGLTGNFAVVFDDFLVNDQDTYLLVETMGKSPYIAALKIERMDNFLTELYNNKSKHKRKPIKIEYQVLSEQGWIFSYYRAGSFISK